MNKKFSTLMAGLLLATAFGTASVHAQNYSVFETPGTTASSFVKQGTAFQLTNNAGEALAIVREGGAYSYKYTLKMVKTGTTKLAETLWKVNYQENREGGPSFSFVSAAYGIPLSFNPEKVNENDEITEFPGTENLWKWQTSLTKDYGTFAAAALVNTYDAKLDSAIVLKKGTDGTVYAQRYKTSSAQNVPAGALKLKPTIAAPATLTVGDLNSMFLTQDPSGKMKLTFSREASLQANPWEQAYTAVAPKGVWSEGRQAEYKADAVQNGIHAAAVAAAAAIAQIEDAAGVVAILEAIEAEGVTADALKEVIAAASGAADYKAAIEKANDKITDLEAAAGDASAEQTYAEAVYTAVQKLKLAKYTDFVGAFSITETATHSVVDAMKSNVVATDQASYDLSLEKETVKANYEAIKALADAGYTASSAVTELINSIPRNQTEADAFNKYGLNLGTALWAMSWSDFYATIVNAYESYLSNLGVTEIPAGDKLAYEAIKAVTNTLGSVADIEAAVNIELNAQAADAEAINTQVQALKGVSTVDEFNAAVAAVSATGITAEVVDEFKSEATSLDLTAEKARVLALKNEYIAESVIAGGLDLSAATDALNSYAIDNTTAQALVATTIKNYTNDEKAAAEAVATAATGSKAAKIIANAEAKAAAYPAGEAYENSEWVSLYQLDGNKAKYLMVDTAFATSDAGNKDLAFAVKEYKSFWKKDIAEPTVKNGIAEDFAEDFDGRYNFKFTYYPTEDSLVIVSDGYAQKPVDVKYWADMTAVDVNATKAQNVSEATESNANVVKISVLRNGTMATLGAYEQIYLGSGQSAWTINTRIGFNADPAMGAYIEPGVYTIQFVSNAEQNKNVNGRYITSNWLNSGQYIAGVEDQNLNHIPAAQWMLSHENGSNLNAIVNRESGENLKRVTDNANVQVQYLYATGTPGLYTVSTGDSLRLNKITDKEALTKSTLGYYAAADYNAETGDQLEVYGLKYLTDMADLFVNFSAADSILNVAAGDEAEVYFRLLPLHNKVKYGASNTDLAADLYRQPYTLRLETGKANERPEDMLYVKLDSDGKYRLGTGGGTPFYLKEFKEADGECSYALMEASNLEYNNSGFVVSSTLSNCKVSVKDYPSILVSEGAEQELIANNWGYYNNGRTSTFSLVKKAAPKYRRLGEDESMNNVKIYSTRNANRYLYENKENKVAGYEKNPLGLNFLGDINVTEADKNLALFVDTAYVRNNTARPQYMLALRPDPTSVLEDCPYDPSHGKHEIPQMKAHYLVTLNDSVANATTKTEEAKFMFENRTYTRLAFVEAIHRGDKLIITDSKFTGTDKAAKDTIDLSKNAFVEGAWQFRLTGNDDEEFYIEGAKSGNYIRLINGVAVVTEDIQDAERFNIEKTDEDATANESIAAVGVQVIAGKGVVTVQGAAGKVITVANILGQTLANQVAASDNVTIAAPAGVVVVSVDGEATKVVVK